MGDLAIVLHSHMPYVEGFGTYPFGEEWLFDAVARSHLPVLEVAERLTMTVTPVLADQLEADGVGERMLEFLRRHRLGAAERDAAEADADLRAAAEAEAEQLRRAIARLEALDGNALRRLPGGAPTQPGRADGLRRDPRRAAQARDHSRAAGSRSTPGFARTSAASAPPDGFWLPECAYVAGHRGGARRARHRLHLPRPERPRARRRRAGPDAPARRARSRSRSTGRRSSWSGRGRLPLRRPPTSSTTGSPTNGIRLWSISGEPYDPAAAASARPSTRAGLPGGGARRGSSATDRGGDAAGLCVFAIDTELLGHWWAEGPIWLREVLGAADARGGAPADACRGARASTSPRSGPLTRRAGARARGSRPGTRPPWPTWSGPPRRLELRLLRALRDGQLEPAAAERAARELLAVQSSDWAFMDHRGQAGDYPYARATAHAEAMLEAIDSPQAPDPRLRNLAPDLSLAPLLEP